MVEGSSTFSYSVEVFHTLSRLFVPTASAKGSHLFGCTVPAKGVSPNLKPEKRGLSTLKTSQKRGLTIKIWSKGVSPNKNFGVPERGLLNLEKAGTFSIG